MIIVGAGLAGLIAANLIPEAEVLEAAPAGHHPHKALLRFRSNAVGEALGIEFQPVTVRKGIWFRGGYVEPNPLVANLYSQKVLGRLADRSIWSVGSATRYIAPENLPEQLADRVAHRLTYNRAYDFDEPVDEPVINTAPMNLLAQRLAPGKLPEFKFASIQVARFRVHDAEVYQTVYFPDEDTDVYRASITGDLLIIEETSGARTTHISRVLKPFGLLESQIEPIDTAHQSFGKIAPIDDGWRRGFINFLTMEHGIYSLGRFATWRNILLDDVLHDISVVKRLIHSDSYELRRAAI